MKRTFLSEFDDRAIKSQVRVAAEWLGLLSTMELLWNWLPTKFNISHFPIF
jgi:hypothetical protein